MHRLMLTSRAYQMASIDIPANVAIDPENRLFWRAPRVRLEAEIIRDDDPGRRRARSIARSAGRRSSRTSIRISSRRARGAPGAGRPDDDPSTWRRSIYVFLKRSIRYPMFETFDQPNLVNSADRRNRTTIAPQALILMNNGMVLRRRAMFADRLKKEAGDGRRPAGRPRVPARAGAAARRHRTPAVARSSSRAARRARRSSATRCSTSTSSCTGNNGAQAHHHIATTAAGPSRSCSTRAVSCSAASAAASPAWRSPICSAVRACCRRRWRRSRRARAENPLAPKPQHFPAKAKAVISVFCYGGVSQIDTFDPKPDLMKWQGETMQGVGQVRTIMGNPGGLMPSPWTFKKYGQ